MYNPFHTLTLFLYASVCGAHFISVGSCILEHVLFQSAAETPGLFTNFSVLTGLSHQ